MKTNLTKKQAAEISNLVNSLTASPATFEVSAFSIRALAQRVGISERHLHRQIASGALLSVKIGRRRLITGPAASAWLNACQVLS